MYYVPIKRQQAFDDGNPDRSCIICLLFLSPLISEKSKRNFHIESFSKIFFREDIAVAFNRVGDHLNTLIDILKYRAVQKEIHF